MKPVQRPAVNPAGGRSRRRRDRKLAIEFLESRQLLALTHLYTFNDGLTNDWIGNAHGVLVNGATVAGGQLVLANAGVTSGQASLVQHVRLPARLLPATGSFTVEAWFTTAGAAAGAHVFDVGTQSVDSGESYVSFTPHGELDDARASLRPAGLEERVAHGAAPNDGAQHVAAIVVDAGADMLRLFMDGAEVDAAPLDGADASSVNDAVAYLGRSLFNADAGFTGSINEVRIYDDARGADSLTQDAAAGPSTDTKSPQVRQMEYLDRGLVAIRRTTAEIHVSWRLLGTDPANIQFNLYRSSNGGEPVKLNAAPIATTTDYVDATANVAVANSYFVCPVVDGAELAASKSCTLPANTAVGYYKELPLQVPAGGVVPDFENPGQTLPFTYNANDASVGDVDCDGE
jgi:hypothetical protein